MIKASRILYVISAAIAGVGIFGTVLTAILSSLVFDRFGEDILRLINENAKTAFVAGDLALIRIFFITAMVIAAVSLVACLITSFFGYRSLSHENGGIAPHVVAIVIGVFTGPILIVAAILAIAGSRSAPAQTEQPTA